MTRPFVVLVWALLSPSLTSCGAHAGGTDDTRAPRSEHRIAFTHQLVVTSPGAKPRVLDPRQDDVATGDVVEAFITPEEDVFVYLGYCNGDEFALYPADGRTLRAEARRRFKIPDPYDIVQDRVLYVIASRAEVSLASPDLAIAIAQSRHAMGRQAMSGDCAGGPGDGAGPQTSSLTPIEVRPPETAIQVVRYEFLQRPRPAAP